MLNASFRLKGEKDLGEYMSFPVDSNLNKNWPQGYKTQINYAWNLSCL